jgi:ribosomal-protein-alanine N-acetyltransferase
MLRRDLPAVLEIEQEAFEFARREEDFLQLLRPRNVLGMVAEVDNRVRGFMVYELQKSRLHLLNFAVGREDRRQGLGRQLVEKLKGKLKGNRHTSAVLEVRESNLTAQLFWRSCGFRCVNVLRNFYEDTQEDAYLMRYQAARPTFTGQPICLADRGSL